VKKVLILQPIHQAGVDILKEKVEIKIASDTRIEKVIEEGRDVHGIIVRTSPLPGSVIRKIPKLEVIGRHGVGVDNIDVKEATRRGIPVVNTPFANTISVVEHTVCLILALAKKLLISDRAVREGGFKIRDGWEAQDLAGKTVGIVGYGKIGKLLAEKCHRCLDMEVIVYDPYIKLQEEQIKQVDKLADLLEQSDFVSLHVSLNSQNKNLIGKEQFNKMKSSSFLINVARGEIVDETALVEALETKNIAGVALDVFSQEPPESDNPLLQKDNVILTPHMAALTRECVIRMATVVVQEVLKVLGGEKPSFIVNPQVYDTRE